MIRFNYRLNGELIDSTRMYYGIDIIKLIDSYEDKRCINCKYWIQELQTIGLCDKGVKEEKQFKESLTCHNFSCNKWESK